MGKDSPSPPQPPNYAEAAREQGVANEATARLQGRINNPNIYGPLGGQTVTFGANDQPTVTQTLTPSAQATLDAQQRVQRSLAGLGEQGIGTAQSVLGSAFNPNLAGLQTNIGRAGLIPQTPDLSRYGEAGSNVNAQNVNRGPEAGLYGMASGGPQAGQYGMASGGPQAGQYGMASGGPQAGQYGLASNTLNTSNIAAMPVNAGMTGQQAIMSRLAPQLEQSDAAMRQRLANQGLVAGGEAYQNAMISQNQQKNDLLTQAALQGIGLDTAANAQGFNQALQSGQFGNQAMMQNFGQGQAANAAQNMAINQNFGQGLSAQQAQNMAINQNFGQGLSAQQAQNMAINQNFGQGLSAQQAQNAAAQQQYNQFMGVQGLQNQTIAQNQQTALQQQQAALAAQNQQYNQLLQGAQFGNTAQQQSLQQQLALRNQPLNEIAGLMSGSQIQMPQFQGYQGANVAGTPIMQGAMAQGGAAMDQYGIQSANVNAQNAGLYELAGTLGAGAMMMASDRRLKSNIARIGTHPLGIGVYEYDIFGERQIGVMADEVEAVMPEAVVLHQNGYKMVNYGMIN